MVERRKLVKPGVKYPAGMVFEGKRKSVPRRALQIPMRAMLRAMSEGRRRPEAHNPFKLPDFPDSAKPQEESGMALDDAANGLNENFQWASATWLNAMTSVFAEGLVFPGYTYLAELAQRAEYRQFAEVIGTEMTRKWIKIMSSATDDDEDRTEKIKQLDDYLEKLKTRDVMQKVVEIDSYFGRAHIYIDIGDPNEEDKDRTANDRDELITDIGTGHNDVSKSKIGKHMLRRLKAVEPMWCYPTNYNSSNPLSTEWYEPTMWYVLGTRVHKSRLLKIISRPVPDILKPAYAFGGLSMSQMAKPYVDNWLNTRQSVADIIRAFSTWILSTDLSSLLEGEGDQLFQRLDFFNLFRNNKGIMAINKETEEFNNVSAPLGTLDALQAQTQEHMAAVARIPIVKLLGIQPAGLNASSEGEIRAFYDWIHAVQEKVIRPPLTIIFNMAQLALWGEIDKDLSFKFVELWELDEAAMSSKRKTDADTDVALIQVGVISPEESRRRIASDPDTPYQNMDVDDLPEPPGQEGEGGMPGMGGGQTDGEEDEEGQLPSGGGPEGGMGSQGGSGGGGPGRGPQGNGGAKAVRGPSDVEAGGSRRLGSGDEDVEEADAGNGSGAEEGRGEGGKRNLTGYGRVAAAAGLVRHERHKARAADEKPKGGSFVGRIPGAYDGLNAFFIALDKSQKQWNEQEHPRGPDGKFVSYGIAPGLAKQAKKFGFKDAQTTSQGKIKLTHANGSVLVVEPAGEGIPSQKFSLYQPGKAAIKGSTGQSGKSFAEKIGPLLAEAPNAAPGASQAAGASKEDVTATATQKYGFVYLSSTTDTENFQYGKYTLKVWNDGYFQLKDGAKVEGVGNNAQELAGVLDFKGLNKQADKIKANLYGPAQGVADSITKDHGFSYDPAQSDEGISLFNKDNVDLKLWGDGYFMVLVDGDYVQAGDKAEHIEKALAEANKQIATKNRPPDPAEVSKQLSAQLSTQKVKPPANMDDLAQAVQFGWIDPAGNYGSFDEYEKAWNNIFDGPMPDNIKNMIQHAFGEEENANKNGKHPVPTSHNALADAINAGLIKTADDYPTLKDYEEAWSNAFSGPMPKHLEKDMKAFFDHKEAEAAAANTPQKQAEAANKAPPGKKPPGTPPATLEAAKSMPPVFAGSSHAAVGPLADYADKSFIDYLKDWEDAYGAGSMPSSIYKELDKHFAAKAKKPAAAKSGTGTKNLDSYSNFEEFEKDYEANHGKGVMSDKLKSTIKKYYENKEKFKDFSNFKDADEYETEWKNTYGTVLDPKVKDALTAHYNTVGAQKAKTSPELEAAQKLVDSKNKMYKTLDDKGYTSVENKALETDGILSFKKDYAIIKVAANGDWHVETPGFSSKQGSGEENLKAFLDGEKAYGSKWTAGSSFWDDEHSPSKLKALEEQKKQQAEAQVKAAEAQKQKNAKKAAWQADFDKQLEEIKKTKAAKMKKWQGPDPSASQKSAVGSYSGSGYSHMNDSLRSGGSITPGSETAHVKEYLDGCHFPEEATLYRGVGGTFASMLIGALAKGSVFQDRGFSSTTIRPDMGFVDGASLKIKISVPKGARGASIKHLSHHSNEDEILFTAGTHYRVLELPDKDNHPNNEAWLHVEMLLPEQHPK